MIKLGNRAINRIQLLLEFDVKHLKLALDNYDDPIRQANTYTAGGKYELIPATKENTQRQLKDSEDALKQITDEVDKATFIFGLSSQKEEVREEVKGLLAK